VRRTWLFVCHSIARTLSRVCVCVCRTVSPEARARLLHACALTRQAMFISLRGNPFKAELDSLQADAMGVGDLPPGLYFSPRRGLRASVPSCLHARLAVFRSAPCHSASEVPAAQRFGCRS